MKDKIKSTGITLTILGLSITVMASLVATSGISEDVVRMYQVGMMMGGGITMSLIGSILTIFSDKLK